MQETHSVSKKNTVNTIFVAINI